jgi:hypothetical protein
MAGCDVLRQLVLILDSGWFLSAYSSPAISYNHAFAAISFAPCLLKPKSTAVAPLRLFLTLMRVKLR